MRPALDIGLSALLSAQKALDTAAHNIANAQTPNFTRQRVELVSRPPSRPTPLQPGEGVEAAQIARVNDAFADRMLLTQDPLAGAATQRSRLLGEIESYLSLNPETGLGAVLGRFFNSFHELSRDPSGSAERVAVVEHAQALVRSFHELAGRLTELHRHLLPEAQAVVGRINELAYEVADLNRQIVDTRVQGGEANDLIDQRLTALRELAELVPINVTYDRLERADVRIGGLLLTSGSVVCELEAEVVGSTLEIRIAGARTSIHPSGGQLSAILDIANNVLPGYLDHLDTLAATIAREVNRRHATGVGDDGSFDRLVGTTFVDDGAMPLAAAGLPFELEAGDLFVSVIDRATGEVTQTKITFDPAANSPNDIVAALDAVAHLRAELAGGSVQLSAEDGYAFDFTNKVPTSPGTLGTSDVALSGTVTLDANDAYTFTADGAGTIGTTAGLTITVTDATGASVASLDVGDTYEPGDTLALPGGFRVSFGAGDVAAGDALGVELAAEPDAADLLAALGLNTFFRGTTAAGLSLEPALAEDPSLIAAGRSGAPGDNTNALRLAAIQGEALEALGGQTVDDHYAELIGRVGLDAQSALRNEEHATLMREAAQNQRDAVSAVNQDEETLNLLRFQQLYAFAARYIRTIDELLEELINII